MSSEVEFLRTHLAAEAGLSAATVEALIGRFQQSQTPSMIRYLADVGVIPPATASTLQAVHKGYASVSLAPLLAALKLPVDLITQAAPTASVSVREAPMSLSAFASVRKQMSVAEPSARGVVENVAALFTAAPRDTNSPEAPRIVAAPVMPQVGAKLGRYTLQEALGTGSTAAIYRGFHEVLETPVAIKILNLSSRIQDRKAAARFIDEAKILARLNHPHIVRVLDAAVENGLPYIVFEYVGAMTLEELVMASGKLSNEALCRVAQQMIEALGAARTEGILHRDVKPANILVRKDGQCKLADFGMAVSVGSGDVDDGELVCGTPSYMAPEQALRPSEVDYRADMYSLGATLYHAACGRPPFVRSTPTDTIKAHIRELPEPIRTVAPQIDPVMADVITKLLSKERQDRFNSYEDALMAVSGRQKEASLGSQTEDARASSFRKLVGGLFRRAEN